MLTQIKEPLWRDLYYTPSRWHTSETCVQKSDDVLIQSLSKIVGRLKSDCASAQFNQEFRFRLENRLILWYILTNRKSPDQTVWIRRFICAFALHIWHDDVLTAHWVTLTCSCFFFLRQQNSKTTSDWASLEEKPVEGTCLMACSCFICVIPRGQQRGRILKWPSFDLKLSPQYRSETRAKLRISYTGHLSSMRLPVHMSSWTTEAILIITKTCPFKYIENFTTKKWKFSDEKIWYFSY